MARGPEPRKLVDEATRGDPEAVECLVERYLPALHAYIRLQSPPQLRRLEETVDLAQSACREVLADLDGHEWVSESRFRHWLFASARSKMIDRLRYWQSEKRNPAREAAPPRGADRTDISWQALMKGSRVD